MGNNIATYTICIDVEKVADIKDIEDKLKREVKKAYKKMMVEILSKKEQKIFSMGKYIKKKRISRYLYSQFGLIRFDRYKAVDRNGKWLYPLDIAVGIEKNSSLSPGVEKRAVYLASQYPYRQACSILSYEIEEDLDHRLIWRLVQKRGKKLRQKQKEEIESLYTHAKDVDKDNKKREIIVIEADGTGISSKEGKGKWMEAKLGIIYTGKKLKSNTSKTTRYILDNKTIYADITDTDTFGKAFSYIAEKNYSYSMQENILFISDGDRGIKNIRAGYLPGSIHQLDHYHLKKRLRQAFSPYPDILDKLLNLINQRKEQKLPHYIRLAKINGAIDGDTASELISYIEDNLSDIWAVDALRGKVKKEVLVTGSGAVEKNIDIVLARRFKCRGMSWSKEGARNLVPFRLMVENGNFDTYFEAVA